METFVLRVWVRASDRPGEQQLRGVVEHVGTGSSATFRSIRELAAHLDAVAGRAPAGRVTTKGPPR